METNNIIFKTATLEELTNIKFKLIEKENLLEIYIEGEKSGDNYSLELNLLLSKEDLRKLPINEKTNITNYLEVNNNLFEKNKVYYLETKVNLEITQYLENHFILTIDVETVDVLGKLEVSFTLSN